MRDMAHEGAITRSSHIEVLHTLSSSDVRGGCPSRRRCVCRHSGRNARHWTIDRSCDGSIRSERPALQQDAWLQIHTKHMPSEHGMLDRGTAVSMEVHIRQSIRATVRAAYSLISRKQSAQYGENSHLRCIMTLFAWRCVSPRSSFSSCRHNKLTRACSIKLGPDDCFTVLANGGMQEPRPHPALARVPPAPPSTRPRTCMPPPNQQDQGPAVTGVQVKSRENGWSRRGFLTSTHSRLLSGGIGRCSYRVCFPMWASAAALA